jgi:hypothetical protein
MQQQYPTPEEREERYQSSMANFRSREATRKRDMAEALSHVSTKVDRTPEETAAIQERLAVESRPAEHSPEEWIAVLERNLGLTRTNLTPMQWEQYQLLKAEIMAATWKEPK